MIRLCLIFRVKVITLTSQRCHWVHKITHATCFHIRFDISNWSEYLLDDHSHNVPIHGIWNMLTVVVANNQFPELSDMKDLFMLLRNCLLQCESVVIFKYSNHNDCSVVVDGIIVGTGNFGAWKWLHSKFCFIYFCQVLSPCFVLPVMSNTQRNFCMVITVSPFQILK